MFLSAADVEEATSFDQARRILAFESVTPSSSSGIITAFSSLIGKTESMIADFVAPLRNVSEDRTSPISFLTSEQKTALKAIEALPFMSYQKTLIMVPEGFQGKLLDYLKFLEAARSDILHHAKDVVNNYTVELSVFISTPSSRDKAKTHERFYKDIQQLYQKQQHQLAAFFDNKKNLSRVPLGSVISRFGEFESLFMIADRLEKSANTNKDLNELVSAVDLSASLLRTIRENIENNKTQTVSGDMAKHIADGAYVVARYVELASTIVYATETALASVKSLADQFAKLK